ncbi:MAG TPA: prepilin-type N-terminal cleavage/methylation domain-containing protein [Flavobacterium sp.]|uniref:prepilin-type N-terminal cleavage/methylation domain-containing protein n=2 Tax=Flavobacterium TaxID=237 RepID=UPI0025BE9FE5|nr:MULTISPECIES: prepilin-type N-terminal cleavage/methylation domain-containing protein [unclassified Flavobacterium]HRE76412.1 prepilin-type N-terminal cleavage/methylation domain-containing protein [Flavobacterium sp.]
MIKKVKSFTLSELIVVMIITVIVVGIAFSVLLLVKKQIKGIEKNYQKTTQLALFEEKFWRDFNIFQQINIDESHQNMFFKNEIDSIAYQFEDEYVIRNEDTLKVQLKIENVYLDGNTVESGLIDAIDFSAIKEIPDYTFFVYKKNDATQYMNQNGL